MTNLQDFYSAGYFIIRAEPFRWPELKKAHMPDKYISLSECFCHHLEISWGWSEEGKSKALAFGIPETLFDDFVQWRHDESNSETELVGMFYTPEAARRFVHRFLSGVEDIHIIGVGLPHEVEQTYWQETQNLDRLSFGIAGRIKQHLPMEEGGTFLGFEVAGFDGYLDFSHSWLCSGRIGEEMYDLFGIRSGLYGLLQTEIDAKKVYEWIAEDEMQGRRGEPEPYYYWLLVEYPL